MPSSGNFQNGVKHGKGIDKLINGEVYEGYFCDGKRQGPDAVHIHSDGSKYIGNCDSTCL